MACYVCLLAVLGSQGIVVKCTSRRRSLVGCIECYFMGLAFKNLGMLGSKRRTNLNCFIFGSFQENKDRHGLPRIYGNKLCHSMQLRTPNHPGFTGENFTKRFNTLGMMLNTQRRQCLMLNEIIFKKK